MMEMDLVGPIGFLPSERHTSAKPPWNISHVSVKVTGPPGPTGPSSILPSKLHLPANAEMALCSGPGAGAWGSCARPAVETKRIARVSSLFMISSVEPILALPAAGHDPGDRDRDHVESEHRERQEALRDHIWSRRQD